MVKAVGGKRKRKDDPEPSVFISQPLAERILSDSEAASSSQLNRGPRKAARYTEEAVASESDDHDDAESRAQPTPKPRATTLGARIPRTPRTLARATTKTVSIAATAATPKRKRGSDQHDDEYVDAEITRPTPRKR